MTERAIKQKADKLSDIFIRDGTAGAEWYKAMYDSGEIKDCDCYALCKLTDLYIAIKQGLINKNNGIDQQRQILAEYKKEYEQNDLFKR